MAEVLLGVEGWYLLLLCIGFALLTQVVESALGELSCTVCQASSSSVTAYTTDIGVWTQNRIDGFLLENIRWYSEQFSKFNGLKWIKDKAYWYSQYFFSNSNTWIMLMPCMTMLWHESHTEKNISDGWCKNLHKLRIEIHKGGPIHSKNLVWGKP